jgi:arabinose-5-phosphate isomerase
MSKDMKILAPKDILQIEADAILAIRDRLDKDFENFIELIEQCNGKVIISALGKSGHIGQKIAATLSSTGTTAIFLHPVEALHGDLGVIDKKDILVMVSNSGESIEVLNLLFFAKRLGVKILSLVGNPDSSLAKESDFSINVSVPREACPLGLAPTASTTATLAVGDAIAMVLQQKKGFKKEDYALLHPGGDLGRRLKLKVSDIMLRGDKIPIVEEKKDFHTVLREMTERANLGVVLVVNQAGVLTGIITDGDLRRFLLRTKKFVPFDLLHAEEVMTHNPRTVEKDAPLSEALRIMEVKGITSLAIVDPLSKPEGIIHLHDILGRGKFFL